MDVQQILDSLQQIIASYSPSDNSSALFAQLQKDALALICHESVLPEDKLTIAGLLPPALLSAKIIQTLIEETSPTAETLGALIKGMCNVPCEEASAMEERKQWLSGFWQSKSVSFTPDDQYALAIHYLSCFSSDETLASGDVDTLIQQLRFCFQCAIEHYAAEKFKFVPESIQKLLHSSAVALFLKATATHSSSEAKSMLALLDFLHNTVFSGKLDDFEAFSESWGIPRQAMELLAREMALYFCITQSTENTIPFAKVHAILTGTTGISDADAFKQLHDNKVIRHSMFVDNACKLDEVAHSIVLSACAVRTVPKQTASSLVDTLTHWKSLIRGAMAVSGQKESA